MVVKAITYHASWSSIFDFMDLIWYSWSIWGKDQDASQTPIQNCDPLQTNVMMTSYKSTNNRDMTERTTLG